MSPHAGERWVRSLASTQLDRAPGTSFEYSSANYAILGLLVKKISGQSYEDYMQAHIFVPLNMSHSYASPATLAGAGPATGYRQWAGVPLPFSSPYPRQYLATGFIWSGAEDLGRYLIAQLNAGRYATASVLSPAGMDAMHSSAAPVFGNLSYGMGWMIESLPGQTVFWHGGDMANFHSDMYLVPDGEWGVAMLYNANTLIGPEVSPTQHIAAEVARRVRGVPVPDPPAGTSWRYPVLTAMSAAILLVEAILAVFGARRLWRWRREPGARPRGAGPVLRSISLPLVPDEAPSLVVPSEVGVNASTSSSPRTPL